MNDVIDQAKVIVADDVNHPQHYMADTPFEVIKVLEAWGLLVNYPLACVIKYIARYDKKNTKLENLKKAQWYLNYEIARLEKLK